MYNHYSWWPWSAKGGHQAMCPPSSQAIVVAVQALPPASRGIIHVVDEVHSSPWSCAPWQPRTSPLLLMASVSQPV